MVEDDNIQMFLSHLDPGLTVMIIYPESTKYKEVIPQFQRSGHAFILHEAKTMVVDGAIVNEPWFTIEHLMVIQAHELGHYRAEHAINAHMQEGVDIENEADWLGCMLLKEKGYHDALILHEEEYECRYNSTPQEDSKKFKEKLGKFVH